MGVEVRDHGQGASVCRNKSSLDDGVGSGMGLEDDSEGEQDGQVKSELPNDEELDKVGRSDGIGHDGERSNSVVAGGNPC